MYELQRQLVSLCMQIIQGESEVREIGIYTFPFLSFCRCDSSGIVHKVACMLCVD